MELSQTQIVGQTLRQSQEQHLSPIQMQGVKLLQSPSLELKAELSQMLVANPVVELVSEPGALEESARPVEYDQEYERDQAASMVERDESLADSMADQWSSDVPVDRGLVSSWGEDDEEKRRYLFESITTNPSAYERLTAQLREECAGDDALLRAGECVIGNLDDKGYLSCSDEELAQSCGESVSTVSAAVRLVQSLKPVGIASRSARECLLAQLREEGAEGSLAWRVVDGYLEDFSRNRLPLIAKALGVELDELNAATARIRELEPFPGRALWDEGAQVIVPEARIFRGESGDWQMEMNHGFYPEILFRPEYKAMLKDRGVASETKRFLQRCFAEGLQYQKILRLRKLTLARITFVIMETQGDFFEYGPGKLRPMTRVELAEILGLHETSIGRAVSGKYLQTPQGLYEYAYFFSTGFQSNRGEGEDEEVSSRAIQERIRELVSAEDPHKPLSDQKIAELLKADGFAVARRTVAKYRELEGIQASSLRRVHVG